MKNLELVKLKFTYHDAQLRYFVSTRSQLSSDSPHSCDLSARPNFVCKRVDSYLVFRASKMFSTESLATCDIFAKVGDYHHSSNQETAIHRGWKKGKEKAKEGDSLVKLSRRFVSLRFGDAGSCHRLAAALGPSVLACHRQVNCFTSCWHYLLCEPRCGKSISTISSRCGNASMDHCPLSLIMR